jgi:cell shape-determining protein MreC
MTTISTNRRRKRISGRTAAFLIVITVILCAGLLWRDAAANLLWRVFSPALSARNAAAAGSSGFFGQFQENGRLASENAQLRAQLASTTARLIDRDYLYAENLHLKEMLGRQVSDPTVLASVILRPPGLPYGMLMLDVGKDSGVREGDLVASEGSAYIGRVSTVYDTAARVTLFSAPGETYQGLLRGEVPVALSGEGGGSMTGEVPAGIDVKPGDPVTLPSIAPQFAAIVSSVVKQEGESFQSVYLTLPVNPLELRYVIVHLRSGN